MATQKRNQPVRQGVLRDDRGKTSIGNQDTRQGFGREQHTGRGNYINYYDDLKLSTTPENAQLIRKQESDFNSEVATNQNKIKEAEGVLSSQYAEQQAKLAAAERDLPGFNEALKDSWKKQQKSFVSVNVVRNEKGKYITEGTYYLPRETAESLAKDKAVATNWGADGKFYVDVKTAKGGRYIGAELHTAFQKGSDQIYNQWYVATAPNLKKSIIEAQNQINKSEGLLNSSYITAKGQIGTAQGQIDSATSNRAAQWEQLRNDYLKKKDTIAQIFSNMKVEEATKK